MCGCWRYKIWICRQKFLMERGGWRTRAPARRMSLLWVQEGVLCSENRNFLHEGRKKCLPTVLLCWSRMFAAMSHTHMYMFESLAGSLFPFSHCPNSWTADMRIAQTTNRVCYTKRTNCALILCPFALAVAWGAPVRRNNHNCTSIRVCSYRETHKKRKTERWKNRKSETQKNRKAKIRKREKMNNGITDHRETKTLKNRKKG